MKFTLRACSSLNTTVSFFRHVFELLASITIGSFYCFQNILKTQDADVCVMVCMKFQSHTYRHINRMWVNSTMLHLHRVSIQRDQELNWPVKDLMDGHKKARFKFWTSSWYEHWNFSIYQTSIVRLWSDYHAHFRLMSKTFPCLCSRIREELATQSSETSNLTNKLDRVGLSLSCYTTLVLLRCST